MMQAKERWYIFLDTDFEATDIHANNESHKGFIQVSGLINLLYLNIPLETSSSNCSKNLCTETDPDVGIQSI